MNVDASTFYTDARLGGAFGRSLAFHLAIVGGLAGYAWWQGTADRFGGASSGAPTVEVGVYDAIPLPTHGPENPLANDTDNDAPQAEPEKPAPKAEPAPDPKDAIALKAPDKKKSKQLLIPKSKLKSFASLAENQLRSNTPQATSDPLFGKSGSAQIGTADSPLGTRFAAYAAIIKDITQRNWHKDALPGSASPATVHFELQRDGSIRNLQLTRRSGNDAMDQSVLSAIQDSVPYPPLPAEYEKSSAPVEFTFRLAQ